jgi:hypothetical protein
MMCRWQFQVAIGDSVPKLFHSSTMFNKTPRRIVRTKVGLCRKSAGQDSGVAFEWRNRCQAGGPLKPGLGLSAAGR